MYRGSHVLRAKSSALRRMEAKENDQTRIQNFNGSRSYDPKKRRHKSFTLAKKSKMKTGRPVDIETKKKINALAQAGFSFSEIANSLKIKSRQLVWYHFNQYRIKNTKSQNNSAFSTKNPIIPSKGLSKKVVNDNVESHGQKVGKLNHLN